MNDPDVRRLAGLPGDGTPIYMSYLHGKSNIIREPASGATYIHDNTYYREGTWTDVRWAGITVISVPGTGHASLTAGGITYFSGWNLHWQAGGYWYYDVYRLRPGP
jgi:hypothetical protein